MDVAAGVGVGLLGLNIAGRADAPPPQALGTADGGSAGQDPAAVAGRDDAGGLHEACVGTDGLPLLLAFLIDLDQPRAEVAERRGDVTDCEVAAVAGQDRCREPGVVADREQLEPHNLAACIEARQLAASNSERIRP